MALHESAEMDLAAGPAEVFKIVTDVGLLPQWNRAITEVVEAPEDLQPGSVWKVRIHALGQSWVSKSTLTELDRDAGTFRYRSQSDDGNPSYADWAWHVAPAGEGARVDVHVQLHPKTFWRKYLLVRLRRPGLRREMEASLDALRQFVGDAAHRSES